MLTLSFVDRVAPSSHISDTDTYATFADLVVDILDPEAFKPAESKDELPLFVPAEFGGRRRLASNVLRLHVFVLDFDHGARSDLDEAQKRIGQYGHICYTSFSHDPNGQKKFRAIVKLSRPVEGTEWLKFWPRAVHELRVSSLVDEHCADAPHMYFMPGGDRAKYEVEGCDGPSLDVDAILQQPLPPGAAEAYDPGLSEPIPEGERGEVTQGLKDAWNAKLMNACDELQKRPYPGTIYDISNGAVFGLARGVPHIIGEDRVRNMVRRALDKRYAKHGNHPSVEADKQKSYDNVEKAIADGKAAPWWPLRSEEHVGRPLTDMGLAERFIDKYRNDVVYEPGAGRWLCWNKKFWDGYNGVGLVQELMMQTVRSIVDEADTVAADYFSAKDTLKMVEADPSSIDPKVRMQAEIDVEILGKRVEDLLKFAQKSEAIARVQAAIAFATSSPQVVRSRRAFDQDRYALNFQNGTLDLRTYTLRPHRREDLHTRVLPHEFDENATCPAILRSLDEMMLGRKDLVDYLIKLIAHTALGTQNEQLFVLCYGDGANGKSTLMNLLLDMFGREPNGYGWAMNSENLLSNRGASRHETWRDSLRGKRLVVALEVDEGRSFNESLIKELTGGDTITARRLYENESSFSPELTLWICVNHRPHVRSVDDGVWRRPRVVPFEADFKERPNKMLGEIMRREIKGFWALVAREACKLAMDPDGLRAPEVVTGATQEYKDDEDPLREYLEAWFDTSNEDSFTSRNVAWGAYVEHHQLNTRQPQVFNNPKFFHTALGKKFKEHKYNGVRGFKGMRLLTPQERHARSPKGALIAAQAEASKKPN